MNRLIATYHIILPRPLRVKRPTNDEPRFRTKINRFDVEIVFIRNGGASLKRNLDQYEIREVPHLKVSVLGQEDLNPPVVSETKSSGRDFKERSSWFSERRNEYLQAAVIAVNRVIRFFKYKMHTPYLRTFTLHDQVFQNPKWTDQEGKTVGSGILEFTSKFLPRPGPGLHGEREFTVDEDEELKQALKNELTIETHQEFLSDAQTSVLENNLRRAVLEMAIACEVVVKQTFFAIASTSEAACEYFYGKERIQKKVIDLIDIAAKETLGESFKNDSRDAYNKIDFLFRCRNKVAHEGKLEYRDDANVCHEVNRKSLEDWWISVDSLMKWLDKHRRQNL